ncbi:MAG: sulfatase [Planctomycetia bacterium]|nr:sulfatase [Planctomycetia bacterium]
MRPLHYLCLSLTGVLFAANSVAAADEAKRPNIVFILADDLGINDLGCYGRADHRTPHLDGLARAGARCTAAYCSQPICSPTRAALMTGKTPARLHLTTFLPGRPDCPSQKLLHPAIQQQLPLAEKTVAECLKEAGYATGYVGKWHLGNKGFLPTDQGFDSYHPGQANTKPSDTEGGKGEYGLTAAAMQFIEANREKPFFLYLSHNNPHIPYTAAEARIKQNSKAFEPTYAAVIETLDDAVGRLLAKLDELKLTDRTLVVFTSDNGGLHVPEGPHAKITHNTPYRAGKGYLYEGGVRIPAIVRWPGRIPAGQQHATPVISADWLPTLVDFAGAKAPAGLDGVSLAGLLTGKQPLAERPLYWHFPHYTNQGSRPAGAVRQGDWKLIEHYDDGKVELFNLTKDGGETTDLAAQEADRVKQLRERLAQWRKEVGAQTNEPNPKFEAALFRQLYVDVEPSRYQPAKASEADLERMLAWRKLMNGVLPKKNP